MWRGTSALCGLLVGCAAGEGVALRARPLDAGIAELVDASACVRDEPEPVPADLAPAPDATEHRYFAIRVLEADSGTPIPGAQLTTVHHVVHTSDRNGVVAFYEPGLMEQDVFFTPTREGYTFPADGFGFRGRALFTREGGEGALTMERSGALPVPTVEVDDRDTRALLGPVPRACFALRVVDQASKRGVPLVFVDGPRERYVSDSQGMVAVCDPDQLGQPLTLSISSHGYSYPPRELTLMPRAGESTRVELVRINLAERVARTTGAGIYRDSILLGREAPLPPLRGGVLAQDSVAMARVGAQQLQTWGVTDRARYPLGNFASCGALDGTYITDEDGFCRALTGTLPPDDLPTWLSAVFNARDNDGVERAYATYAKPNGNLSIQGRGLLRFDPVQRAFVDTGVRLPLMDFVAPDGQALTLTQAGEPTLYFASGVRVPARESALREPSSYQPLTVISALRDTGSGTSIAVNGNAAQAYSSHRQRYVRVFSQLGGSSSFLGEVWYAEADTPLGPWVYAQKVLTHERYSFYAPFIHDALVAHGRSLSFEGTYTDALAGAQVARTPRYNRNQLTYLLDLDQVALPVAFYSVGGALLDKASLPADVAPLAPAFFAPDHAAQGLTPFAWSGPSCEARTLVAGDVTPPIFHAYAADDARRPAHLVPLVARDGGSALGEGTPLAYVWPPVVTAASDVAAFVGPLRASAGPDQCVAAGQEVVLDGSGSRVPAGDVRFTWLRYGNECARSEGRVLRATLPPGVHTFILELEDPAGNRSRDAVTLRVQ